MVRTLLLIAAVSFVLCLTCLVSAFAIVGGPFNIDDNGGFHHVSWSQVDLS